jgi:peptidoglycan hydrolase-like protein with peptidoglycan-binding domain
MTVEQAKQKLLAWAAEQIGYREGGDNYNQYAAMPEISRLLGWDAQNQPWCNIFVLAAFVCCFGLDAGAAMLYQRVGRGSALCRASAQFFKDAGAWHTRPEPGDIIFFYVNGDINHQGVVIRVYGGSIVTVEGNSSDQVAERVYQLGASNIAGYGRPNWALAAGEDTDVPTTEEPETPAVQTVKIELPVLRNGMGGGAVAMMQGALVFNKCSLPLYGADGEFGAETQTALRNFQVRKGLEPTGVCDKATWEALRG